MPAKTTHLILALFMLPMACYAQFFNKHFDYQGQPDFGMNVIIDSSDMSSMHYYVLGSGGATSWQQHSNDFVLMKIKGDGTQQQIITTVHDSNTTYSINRGPSYARLPGGGVAVALNRQRSTTSGPNAPITIQVALMKLKPNGDTAFIKYLNDTTLAPNETLNTCIALPDKGFMLGGRSGNGTILYRTDSAGNIIWSHLDLQYAAFKPEITSMQYLDNGNVLVGAHLMILKHASQYEVYWYYAPWFFIVDTLGNTIKERLYTTRYSGSDIYKDKLGGYYSYGVIDSVLVPNDANDLKNFPSYFMHLDDSFNVQWVKMMGDTVAYRSIYVAKETQGGSFILAGVEYSMAHYGYGFVRKLTHTGSIEWTNYYAVDTANVFGLFEDVLEMPDKGFALTGTAGFSSGPTHGNDVWLLRIDSNGCYIPGCAPTAITEEHNLATKSLNLYPNPSNGSFTLEVKQQGLFIVSDLQGRTIGNYKVQAGQNKILLPESQASGIYFGVFCDNKGERTNPVRIIIE